MDDDLQKALEGALDWIRPKVPQELVIVSSGEVVRGLCIRIGKRAGVIPFYEVPPHVANVLSRHFVKGGHRAWIKMSLIRVRSPQHKGALHELGLPTSGLLLLNPLTWKGWGASPRKFDYWRRYGSKWYEKMKADAEAHKRTMDFLAGLREDLRGE